MNRVAASDDRRYRAVAPVRIADLGGWTDTWFSGHGLVCNVAVQPGVTVDVASSAGAGVLIDAVDFGDRYELATGRGRHPLLEAAVDEVGCPPGRCLTIRVRSAVPPGASTGTSAAVTVALVAALQALQPGPAPAPGEIAAAAHRVESERVGRQTGIQDQLCSAFGGVNLISMRRYPEGDVRPVTMRPDVAADLDAALVLVLLGRTHRSSEVHERVIAELEAGGPGASARLQPLRDAAAAGHAALVAGDLDGYGRALVANTDGQAALHPDLVGPDARRAIDAARRHGVRGWKVNGAGGAGGSVTLLARAGAGAREALAAAVTQEDAGFRWVPTRIDHAGVTVTTHGPTEAVPEPRSG